MRSVARRAGKNVFLAVFLAWRARDVYAAAADGVDSRVIHTCRGGKRGWGENLNLFGVEFKLSRRKTLQLMHIRLRTSRMRRDEIIRQELLFAETPVGGFELSFELQKALDAGLSHKLQNAGNHMFGREFELTGHMMSDDRVDISVAACAVGGDKIGADAAGDKNPSDTGQRAQFFKQLELRPMVNFQ